LLPLLNKLLPLIQRRCCLLTRVAAALAASLFLLSPLLLLPSSIISRLHCHHQWSAWQPHKKRLSSWLLWSVLQGCISANTQHTALRLLAAVTL